MTREEAIKDIRENIKPVVGGKSLDMAIRSLEAWDEVVTVETWDDEHQEFKREKMTIAEMVDQFSDEGLPKEIEE